MRLTRISLLWLLGFYLLLNLLHYNFQLGRMTYKHPLIVTSFRG